MDHQEKNSHLEQRIEELEYRISILEKFIDSESSLLSKNDRSAMDSIKIWILAKLKQKKYKTSLFENRLGKSFYIDD